MSTLNFLDSSNFASKPREEKASFLKGLLRVLPGFSDRLKRRKILPSLLDEVSRLALRRIISGHRLIPLGYDR